MVGVVLSSNTKARRRTWTVAAIAVVAAVVAAAAIVGPRLAERRDGGVAVSPSPSASPTETARVSPSPTPTATTSPTTGRHENPILVCRITFPEGYRRSRAVIVTGHEEALGGDFYTLQTEREEREQCLRDGGDVGFPRTR